MSFSYANNNERGHSERTPAYLVVAAKAAGGFAGTRSGAFVNGQRVESVTQLNQALEAEVASQSAEQVDVVAPAVDAAPEQPAIDPTALGTMALVDAQPPYAGPASAFARGNGGGFRY